MQFFWGFVFTLSLLFAACLVKAKYAKIILSVVGLFLCTITGYVSGYAFLYLFGYRGLVMTVVLHIITYMVYLMLLWKPFDHKKRNKYTFSLIAVSIVVVIATMYPHMFPDKTPEIREEINLYAYMPFGNPTFISRGEYNGEYIITETLAATLDEDSTLKLGGDLPRLDGATALYPLYSAFVRATYPEFPEHEYRLGYDPYTDLGGSNSLVICSRTAAAFENLIDGYADIAFLMGVSSEQRAMAESRGLELVLTPIGREAFVFFVNRRNSVSNVSSEDIRQIYSGQITNWNKVGGKNNDIRAYQRQHDSGSQIMLRQIMGTTPIMPAQTEDIQDMMMGMYTQVANYRNYKNALGYSFLYYIRDMIGENKVKFLSIDNIAPTPENITSGTYPFANDFYAVTVHRQGDYLNPHRTGNIDSFLDWIRSPQGQYLVEKTGYGRMR
ncbi:MAG: substrate-binding domain-containing protein [Oscillospiraceae bacterium]|nr:substrate-binding domain-containing protein [Oscillospiraceae bacterium]